MDPYKRPDYWIELKFELLMRKIILYTSMQSNFFGLALEDISRQCGKCLNHPSYIRFESILKYLAITKVDLNWDSVSIR